MDSRRSSGAQTACYADLVRLVFIGVLVGLSTTAPSTAQSDDGDADVLFEEGLRFLDAGDFERALERFEAVYKSHPTSNVLLNIGTALLNLKRNARAANVYQRYLETADADPRRIKQVQAILERLDSKLGLLVIRVDSETTIDVHLDDELVGASPPELKVRVTPGAHSVSLEDDQQTTKFRISAGKRHELAFSGPLEATELNVGLEDAGDSGSSSLNRKERLGLAFGATGLVALGVGTGFAIDAQRRFNRIEEQCAIDCVYPVGLDRKAERREQTAIVLATAGALVVVGGLTLYLLGRREGKTAAALVPTASGAVGALAWTF